MQKMQSYITALSNRGLVISRSVATSAAEALIKQHPGAIAYLDFESSSWAQSLFRRMGYVRRRHTSTKVDIPDVARREVQYVFLYEIVFNIEKHSIPHSMVINFDQTPLKIDRCGKSTLTKKNNFTVTITATADKKVNNWCLFQVKVKIFKQ